MTSIKKRVPLLFLFVIGLMCVGFYLYMKPSAGISKQKAVEVTAATLYQNYLKDFAVAQQAFSGKVLLVSGVLAKTSKNQQGESLLFLATGEDGAFINCSMEKSSADLTINKPIKIKGICSGIGQGDPDLGIKADVYLTRCLLDDSN